jgi:hypothetical protein
MIEVVCTSLSATSRPKGGRIAKINAWPMAFASRPVMRMKKEDLLSRLGADEEVASAELIILRCHPGRYAMVRRW